MWQLAQGREAMVRKARKSVGVVFFLGRGSFWNAG